MKNSLLLPLFVFVLSILASCQTPPKPSCGPEVRAAFDVGSGSTKMRVVEFNTCTQDLVKVLLEDQIRVNYQDALQTSPDQNFSEEVQESGFKALKTLKERALLQNASRFSGVATAAFRKAKNAPVYIERVQQNLKLNIRIISQEQEALLGFKGAAALSKIPVDKLILWDIGGGSQQMVAQGADNKPVIYYGDLASVSFKNYILTNIQKKDLHKSKSPNPLSARDVEAALLHSEMTAANSVPGEIKDKVLNQKAQVVGIGGVLSRSVYDQTPHNPAIHSTDILKSLQNRRNLTDEKIGGDFPQTELSNLALVYGFMRALQMPSYLPIKASLIDGLWFEKEAWQ